MINKKSESRFTTTLLLFFSSLLLLNTSCQKEEVKIEPFALAYPSYFPEPVYKSADNQLTMERFVLGKKLFFDRRLSSDGTISCASCHAQTHAFADHNVSFSAGVNGALGIRNSPTIVNMLWSKSFMWDGGVNHLEVFSVAPITHPDEMNETMANVVAKLNQDEEYQSLVKKAYGHSTVTDQAILKALTAYMVSIVSVNSKYDQVRQGKSSYSAEEKKGYELFKKHCASCHSEPLFTNGTFQNNGLDSVFTDLGRGKITLLSEDVGKFKVPTLRNSELTYPYMHDGRFWTLDQVLDYYSHGIQHSETLSPLVNQNLSLTGIEKKQLKAFLFTLTDYNLLNNPLFFE
jgi:cytochrome c peroxidase